MNAPDDLLLDVIQRVEAVVAREVHFLDALGFSRDGDITRYDAKHSSEIRWRLLRAEGELARSTGHSADVVHAVMVTYLRATMLEIGTGWSVRLIDLFQIAAPPREVG